MRAETQYPNLPPNDYGRKVRGGNEAMRETIRHTNYQERQAGQEGAPAPNVFPRPEQANAPPRIPLQETGTMERDWKT